MMDLLSKQEKQKLEFYEKYGGVPVDGLDNKTPAEPIVRRLVNRGLLVVIDGGEGRLTKVDIAERGLIALRGGEWSEEEDA